MTDSVSEELLEQYVRHPEALAAADRLRVDTLLPERPAAHRVTELLRTFYADFERAGNEAAESVRIILDTLFPPGRIIALHPASSRRGARGRTVLAAMAPVRQDRFETLARLVSEEEQVLVRFLYDRKARRGRLYTLAKDESLRSNVLISFPDLSTHFVTDEHGRVDCPLDSVQAAFDWQSTRVLLRRAVAVFTVSVAELEARGTVTCETTDVVMHCRLLEDAVHLQVEAEDGDAPVFAVVREGDKRHLSTFTADRAQIEPSGDSDSLTIRLYP